MTNKQVILHGEAMLFPSQLPSDAEPIQSSHAEYHIIADSETTGNHHVIDSVPGVRYFRSKSTGNVFVENTKPTKVRCVHPNRHNAITIEPGVWETTQQLEYDHFSKNLEKVRD